MNQQRPLYTILSFEINNLFFLKKTLIMFKPETILKEIHQNEYDGLLLKIKG